MRCLLLDVNLILDVLLDRRPYADDASAVWAAVESGRARGVLSEHAVTTVHYLNDRGVAPRRAADTTEALLSVFEVAPVDAAILRTAAAMRWPDFEDAVTAAATALARMKSRRFMFIAVSPGEPFRRRRRIRR